MEKCKGVFKVFMVLAAALFLSIGMAASVQAATFTNPPETNAPGWQTNFPYQRNIYWNFSVNPAARPPGPLPGADYKGWADPDLWESDYVELGGDVVWNSDLGAIGIEGAGNGAAIFHLDNFLEPLPVKHVYLEATVINSNLSDPEYFWNLPYLGLPSGYKENFGYWNYFWTYKGKNSWLLDMWFEVTPNPPWEDIILSFYVPAGEYVWIDDLHIATECVPIPSTLLLLGSGFIGLIGFKRKLFRGQ